MMAKAKAFPGGKEYLTQRVKGEYTTSIQGFKHDDTVGYENPSNIKKSRWQWKLLHWSSEVPHKELQKEGISYTNTAYGKAEHRQTELAIPDRSNLIDPKKEKNIR